LSLTNIKNGFPLGVNVKKAGAVGENFKVQRGTLTNFGASEDIQTVTLPNPVGSLDKAFVRITNTMHIGGGPPSSGANQNADDMGATAILSDIDTITFIREAGGSNQDQRVEWEVIEYVGPDGGANEFIVRSQAEEAMANVNFTVDINNIFNLERAVPFLTGVRNSDTSADGNQLAVTLYMENVAGQDRLSANRGDNTGLTTFSYAVVEFTGSNWNIGHVRHRFTSINNQIVTMYQEADAFDSGTVFNVVDWNTAFIESQHQVDVEEGIEEIASRIWRNSADTTSLIMDLESGSDNVAGRNYIGQAHIIQNNDMAVEWFDSNTEAGFGISNDADFNITVADVGDTEQASIWSTLTSSGSGTAYSRNSRNYQLTAPDNVAFWGHRSGNNLILTLTVVKWPVEPSSETNQLHFRWRDNTVDLNNDGGWLAGEDSNEIGEISKNKTYRLRIEAVNSGDAAESQAKTYELQWGEKTGADCAEISDWIGIGDANDEFAMRATNYIDPDGEPTDSGMLANTEGYSYLQGQGQDTADTTALIGPLTNGGYSEIEYSFGATNSASPGVAYCFRLYDQAENAPLDGYPVFPEVTIKIDRQTDFFIQRGSLQLSGTEAIISAEIDYEAPASIENAFIRLTNTQITGAGDDSAGGSQNADDVTVYISNPENLLSGITFVRAGAANNTRVSWEIIEYIGPPGGANEIVVRNQGVSTYGSNNTDVSSGAISGVADDNKLVPFITGQMNPDTGRNDYNTTLSTALWDGANDEIDFIRGEAGGDAVRVSWAAVEFVGLNWNIQRTEHVYSVAGAAETENITPVNDLSRAFLHTQKRVGTGLSGLDEFGHEVWISALNRVSFRLQSGASTPSRQVSVAWVIENTQTAGSVMAVTRSDGTQTGGSEPSTVNVNIGKTIVDLGIASIFINNRVDSTGTTYPRAMMGAEIISNDQYQLWISDTGQTRTYRTEIVEWPTATVNYALNGVYVSNPFNAGAPAIFNAIEWTWNKTSAGCANCTLKLQIKTAPDAGGSPGVWSPTWCGPEGEDGDETDYFTISGGELINQNHNGDQWIRYRAEFAGDGNNTPVLSDVRINYKNF